MPLEEILRTGRPFSRGALKRRLYDEGYKERRCEECGQAEEWRGRRLALILDHVNGAPDDNRLENLRILCPNCAATLETHCGRNARSAPRPCEQCGALMVAPAVQRFCSRACYGDARRGVFVPRPATRKVERPALEQLEAEIAAAGWSATARRYGVSDNAVRKWVRNGRRARAHEAADAPDHPGPPASP